jgi:hypothetical protein
VCGLLPGMNTFIDFIEYIIMTSETRLRIEKIIQALIHVGRNGVRGFLRDIVVAIMARKLTMDGYVKPFGID